MEASALVKAHAHAHAAAVATRQATETTVAISEHAHAAGEFARAARSTTSVEALRTLRLLEEHHRKLAAILSLPSEPEPEPEPESESESELLPAHQELGQKPASPSQSQAQAQGRLRRARRPADGAQATADASARASGLCPASSPSQQRRFAASREMSSSIASNLASARGIRSRHRGQPLSPSVSVDQAPGNVDPHPRRDGSRAKMQNIMEHQPGRPTWVPPTPSPPQKPDGRPKGTRPEASQDGGYARFYSTFGSLINKMSAPLAFAGLPLIQEESAPSAQAEATADAPASSPPPPSSSARRKAARPPSSLATEPELSKIYSKATMRALAREGHGGASDSFYVVPTSGHTMARE